MPPLLDNKNPTAKSVFAPSALLREARRQKGLATAGVPATCVLDPDGDIVRRLKANGQAHLASDWPCYHTELYTFTVGGQDVGRRIMANSSGIGSVSVSANHDCTTGVSAWISTSRS